MIAQALAHTHSKQALNKKPALLPINGAPQNSALIQSAEQVGLILRLKRGRVISFLKQLSSTTAMPMYKNRQQAIYLN
jgi:malonyl-CoA O-methyltransferase